jgi:hypothetical protein
LLNGLARGSLRVGRSWLFGACSLKITFATRDEATHVGLQVDDQYTSLNVQLGDITTLAQHHLPEDIIVKSSVS